MSQNSKNPSPVLDDGPDGPSPAPKDKDAWHVYIVRCADQTLYTGVTNDLPARILQHNAGRGAKYTRARLPVELVYREEAAARGEALRREHQIKRLPLPAKRELIAARPAASEPT